MWRNVPARPIRSNLGWRLWDARRLRRSRLSEVRDSGEAVTPERPAASKNELRLTWAHGDPGVVHLRRDVDKETLCGKPALYLVGVSRRFVTCKECAR